MPQNWELRHLEVSKEERWWQVAYELFLDCDPVEKIRKHCGYIRGDHNDDEFTCDTPIPHTGTHREVSKKAILVVISRSKKMDSNNWMELKNADNGPGPHEDISSSEKKLINCIIDLLYESTGTPKPIITRK